MKLLSGDLLGQRILRGRTFSRPLGTQQLDRGAATGPDRPSLAANLLGDGAWVLLSVLLLVLYSAQMTAIGVTFIIAQALAVSAVFAIKLAGFKTLQA